MPASVDVAEVERIATLARLELTDAEKRLYARQLTRILEFASQIRSLDTEGVPPMTRVEGEGPVERDDEPRASLAGSEAVANAPDARGGLFVVPKVI